MKNLILMFFLFILVGCNDPYELSQNKFEKIYYSNKQGTVYFNQEKTIIFVCVKGEVYTKKGGRSCNGRRNYIKLSALSEKLKKQIVKDLTVDSEKIEIRKLIKNVSKITNKSFIVHPKVNGVVPNIKSQTPSGAFNEFSSILQAYGYTLINKNDVIIIEPNYK